MMRQVVQSAIDHPHKNDYYPIACEEFDKAHSIDRNSKTGGAIPIERSRRGAQTIQVNRELLILFLRFPPSPYADLFSLGQVVTSTLRTSYTPCCSFM